MARRFISLSIILIFIFILKSAVQSSVSREVSQSEILELLNSDNPENKLAMGFKLPISELNSVSLEYIPGLSDSSKSLLLTKREQIIASAKKLPADQKYKALLKVKGIGTKKAQDIYQVLSLD